MRKKLQRFGYLDKGWDRYKKRCLYPRFQNNARRVAKILGEVCILTNHVVRHADFYKR